MRLGARDPMTLRIGVVGLGRITRLMHLPHLRELADRFRVAGVCDISPGLARLMAGRFDVPLAGDGCRARPPTPRPRGRTGAARNASSV